MERGKASIYASIYYFIVLALFLLGSIRMAFFFFSKYEQFFFKVKSNMITSNVLSNLNIPFSHFISLD